MRDKVSQFSKGYGFVKFLQYEEAEKAIEKVSRKILREDMAHRPLQVKFANTDSSGVVGSSVAEANGRFYGGQSTFREHLHQRFAHR